MIQWVLGNWAEAVVGLIAILKGASILARMTKTDKDDKFIAKALFVLGLTQKK